MGMFEDDYTILVSDMAFLVFLCEKVGSNFHKSCNKNNEQIEILQ